MRTPTILLRSSWQYQNIGDIAHTPGMLALIERYLPSARVILWYSGVGNGVEAMLRRRFPRLEFVPACDGITPGPDHQTDGPCDLSAEAAMDQADLLLHGSGPSLCGEHEVRRFRERFPDKPWGAIGVTLQAPSSATAALLNSSSFIYARETHTLDHLSRAGVTAPLRGFAPDASFAHDLLDHQRGDAFLRSVNLLDHPFICVIPRLRKTPYYRIHADPRWTAAGIAEVERLNARHAEPDHAKLRDVITAYVRQTGGKVLLCSEMEYQVEIQRPLLFDPLPSDVKPNVINRDAYWRNDEAAAVYKRAQGLIGCECHSPIFCAVNGIPGFYVRQPEDTIKGQMWYDLGLDDRIAEIEQTDGPTLADRFISLISCPQAASSRLRGAMEKCVSAHDQAFATVASIISGRQSL